MRLIAPMVPHVAEEAWAAAGHEGLVADAAWPVVDPAVLIEDEVTIAIQINGKLRDTLTLPKGTERADIEAAALASDKIARALDGTPPRKGIVVPDRLVRSEERRVGKEWSLTCRYRRPPDRQNNNDSTTKKKK